MIIEGRNPVKEALSAESGITKLYVQSGIRELNDLIQIAKSKGINVKQCEKRELDKLSETGRHQGVIAQAKDYEYASLDDIKEVAKQKGEKLFVIILDEVEDPHNLGSVIRICECAGAHGVIIPRRRSASVNATVMRVSAGATSYVKVAQVNNINDTIRELKEDFVTVCCADMDGENMYKAHLDCDIALVIGNEGSGVRNLTAKLCDKTISIPQYGKLNSLNASVACGIMAYEIVRQRKLN